MKDLKEIKEVIIDGYSMDVKFIPILYTRTLHSFVLTEDEEQKFNEFRAKLLNRNNGKLPEFDSMSSTGKNMYCSVMDEDVQYVARVYFKFNVTRYVA